MKEVNAMLEIHLNVDAEKYGRVQYCTLTLEDHVPRHSRRIDPPEWESREFDTEEEAKAWLEEHDGTSFSVIELTTGGEDDDE